MPDSRPDAWAVVGSGPHGLSALKALLQCGVPARGFEREAEVGGNWNPAASGSRVYATTHAISSRPLTQFPDFPMPDAYPDYPAHGQLQAYLQQYARHFGLYDRIAFGADVVDLQSASDGVDLTVRDTVTGRETTTRFAGAVIANGHNWSPRIPEYPGLSGFGGQVLHAAQYKDAEVLKNRRVLVVGAGNTGCDIAVEAATHSARTVHSVRRGYRYTPKFLFGRPSDQLNDLLLALRLPLAARRALLDAVLRVAVGDLGRFGLPRPDHSAWASHPIVNQLYPHYLGHGEIVPKPDVDHFEADAVQFLDGSREPIDLVVLATGYRPVFPFAPPDLLTTVAGRPRLGHLMFSPNEPRVVVSGLVQTDSGQWTIAHWQAMLAARYAQRLGLRPEQALAFHAAVCRDLDRSFSAGAVYTDSERHAYEVAHQEYLGALQSDLHLLEATA